MGLLEYKWKRNAFWATYGQNPYFMNQMSQWIWWSKFNRYRAMSCARPAKWQSTVYIGWSFRKNCESIFFYKNHLQGEFQARNSGHGICIRSWIHFIFWPTLCLTIDNRLLLLLHAKDVRDDWVMPVAKTMKLQNIKGISVFYTGWLPRTKLCTVTIIWKVISIELGSTRLSSMSTSVCDQGHILRYTLLFK